MTRNSFGREDCYSLPALFYCVFLFAGMTVGVAGLWYVAAQHGTHISHARYCMALRCVDAGVVYLTIIVEMTSSPESRLISSLRTARRMKTSLRATEELM